MAGRRLLILKSLCKSSNTMSCQSYSSYGKCVNYADPVLVRPSYAFVSRGYHTKETQSSKDFANTQFGAMGSGSLVNARSYRTKPISAFSSTLSSSHSRFAFAPVSVSPVLDCRSYSSLFGSNADKGGQPGVPAASSGGEVDVGNSAVGGSDLVDKVKEFVQNAVDAATYTGQKAKEASGEMSPYVQQLLDTYPHLRNVVAPVGYTLAGTVFAWVVMPRLFRRFHKYANQGRNALLSQSPSEEQVPYEKSFWGALEDPVRYLFTFMAFSQIGTMVAPTAIAAQYLAPAWSGAVILSFVWFLYRWKTNVFTRALANKSLPSSLDRERLLALDKISSVGLFMIGIMALAEACGVAVQSIMTVGGIGGVATAFAARDVLGNVLSGLSFLVVPKDGKGHLFPCLQLCNHLTSRNYHITLILESDLTSSIPSCLLHSPLFRLTILSSCSTPSPFPSRHTLQGLEPLLAQLRPDPTRPVFAVIDHIMSKTQEVFWKFGIPTVVFITSGAAWAAIQHAVWVVRPGDMKPGEARALPGLPENMVVTYSDLQQRRAWIPSPPPHKKPSQSGGPGGMKPPRGPPLPGEPAPWVEEVKSSSAILINTCDDLERPFLDYVSELTGKPVWGVGPLLPEQYWQSFESLVNDPEIRPKRESNYTEDEVIQWLDSKPRGSVVYVSFGSEVNPTEEEYPELAKALEESTRPFIWVIQRKSGKPGPGSGPPGESYFPHGLDAKVGKRGLIIHGWAPQLLILSHASAGGFISHCGWNSTLEAVVRGVPLLAWPIRGDQYYNAKMVVSYLRVGSLVAEGYPADKVTKEDIVVGLERILEDEEIRKRSAAIRDKFENGYPASSLASLDAFCDFVNNKFV